MSTEELPVGAALLARRMPGGELGLHWPMVGAAEHADGPTLTLCALRDRLAGIQTLTGTSDMLDGLSALLREATPSEAPILSALDGSHARESIVLEAVAARIGADPASLLAAFEASDDIVQTIREAIEALDRNLGPTPRSPELEEAIAAAPADPEPALVYADWLMERDQLHGSLIAATLSAGASHQDRRAWVPMLHRLTAEELRASDLASTLLDERIARWQHGLIRRLRITRPSLWHPMARLLERSLSAGIEGLELPLAGPFRLDTLGALRALRHLRLKLKTQGDPDLSPLADCPRLDRLCLEDAPHGTRTRLLGLPPLRCLEIRGAIDVHTEDLQHCSGLETLILLPHHNRIDPSALRLPSSLKVLVLYAWPGPELLDALPGLRVLATSPATPTERFLTLQAHAEARGVELVSHEPYLSSASVFSALPHEG